MRGEVDAVILIGALAHVPKVRFPAPLARIRLALKPGGHVLLTIEARGGNQRGQGWPRDCRVFVLWRDQDLLMVFSGLGLEVVEAFPNASALGTGETWLGYVLETHLTYKPMGKEQA